MSNINVSYDEMQREANNLVTAKDQIVADLNRLQAQIQGLVESGFVTDQASVRFNESYQQFTTGAQSTIEGLQEDVIEVLLNLKDVAIRQHSGD